ncbi:MAG: putative oxidoreductase C-terminal domain-containing protein [Dysgonamonadaceae bacterium]|nr:putative oxidoreductase C-terminal domain-containing protein [Dysgonamonadaceae bacterium]
MKYLNIAFLFLLLFSCKQADKKETPINSFTGEKGEVKLIVLAPGHFHADLLQKNKLDQINDSVYVYAQEGSELNQYIARVESYNNREENPTQWQEVVYRGDDFLEKMLEDKVGNVVVLAGNNKEKTRYIFESVAAGFNVLSDKPMAINKDSFELLKQAYDTAQANNVMLYDMMTERYDVLNIIEQKLINNKDLFGELQTGTESDPAISMESVHHFYKEVSGKTLIRPAWYYDVEQQGEGIADVTTHLIDLTHWKSFPEEVINYKEDVEIISATHWPTELSLDDFTKSTNVDTFPNYLEKYVKDGKLKVYANGTINYKVKDVNVGLKVIWNYKAPEGSGDTFSATMKGTKASLKTIQNKSTNFTKQLYVEKAADLNKDEFESHLREAIEEIKKDFPTVSLKPSNSNTGEYLINIPDEEKRGHEAHFQNVAQSFFDFLVNQNLPEWEVSNTLAKYYIITTAVNIAKEN